MENNTLQTQSLEAELLRPEVAKIMLEAGITVSELVKHGKEGMSASTERYDRYGDSVGETPNWGVRHKYWSGFLEIFKLVHGSGTTVNVGLSTEEREVEEMFKEYRK